MSPVIMAAAVVLSAALVVIAAIHLVWALGIWWPVPDETRLARAVVGTEGVTRMPGAIPCSIVVVALLFASAWPWFMAAGDAPLGRLGGWVLTGVFFLRGGLSYTPFWRRLAPEDPFARLDRTLYGPICLALGAGFLVVTAGTG
ncbi:MAG: DUF3995 domain-containing protein [Pseudomonadota bacterium]